jgi:hypothetical protein
MIGSNGYVKVRVGRGHPLADPHGYAYEHLIVWVSAGRERPPDGWLIHHRNDVKTDNRLSNLELKERVRHSIDHAGTLTDDQVRAIRVRYDRREAHTATLAAEYGVNHGLISKIVKGQTRTSAGGPIQVGSLRGRFTRQMTDAQQ